MKGSNPGAMPENSKEKEGIESGRNAGEPKTKRTGRNSSTMPKNLKNKRMDRIHA